MCIVNVCFKHYCLFDWDTHFFPLWANHCLSYFNLTFCIWLCICICAIYWICIRWKSRCSSPSRWRIEVKWKCPRQIIMLSRQSRTARAPAGLLAAPEFRFFSSDFLSLFSWICVFSQGYTSIKSYQAKAKRAENPHLGARFCFWILDFPIEFFPFYFPYSYHRMFPSLPSSLKSKQIVRLSHQSEAPGLHPHCLHRWNFRISPKKELLDEFSMREDVSQCSDS